MVNKIRLFLISLLIIFGVFVFGMAERTYAIGTCTCSKKDFMGNQKIPLNTCNKDTEIATCNTDPRFSILGTECACLNKEIIKKVEENKVNLDSSTNLPADPTNFTSIGDIISRFLPYVYVIAGIILLLMLIAGGIGLMTSAGNPDKTKASMGKITGGLIGFAIIFVSYFIARIAETILGVKFM